MILSKSIINITIGYKYIYIIIITIILYIYIYIYIYYYYYYYYYIRRISSSPHNASCLLRQRQGYQATRIPAQALLRGQDLPHVDEPVPFLCLQRVLGPLPCEAWRGEPQLPLCLLHCSGQQRTVTAPQHHANRPRPVSAQVAWGYHRVSTGGMGSAQGRHRVSTGIVGPAQGLHRARMGLA